MTEAERMARAHRAQSALDEFFSPIFDSLRDEYVARISEVATTELHPTTRADAVTTLSVALKVVDTLKAGITEVVRDGELARRDKIRAESIERMSDAQQRLLKITGY